MEKRDARMSGGVLCSGSIIYDTLVHPAEEAPWGTTTFVDTIEPHPGGNGSNTSLALAKLGTAVRLMGAVGGDDHGRFLAGELARAGVDTSAVQVIAGPTAATIALVNGAGDRRFLHRMGVSTGAFPEPVDFVPPLIAGMTHYHLASLFILPRFRSHAPETLARARAAGLGTSLDTNWDPLGRWMEDIGPCLPHLDFVFMNEDEARMVTGHTGSRQAGKVLLDRGARTAVLKLGARGCAVYTGDHEILSPAFAVPVKDTTGAGDCFVGAFLCARLRGASLEEAARFANAVGAISVQHVGGAAGLPNLPDVPA
jgi:sugar/nucleoside kinase (ribokinase family)